VITEGSMKIVFLGAGGRRPGLWCASDQAEVRCVLELPVGHSVYAIDANAQTGAVAVGTRRGDVEVLTWQSGDVGHGEPSRRTLYQGAPVLAVCLVGQGRLAVADTWGRCLLWRYAEEGLPVELPGADGRVCALLHLGEDRMAGLTEEGNLLLWDVGRLGLCSVTEGPAPARKSALVRLLKWPDREAIVYPAEEGHVACFSIAEERSRSWPAHRGDCYAMVVEGDCLLTVGRADGLVKSWSEPDRQAQDLCRCGEGIIAAQRIGLEDELLLVDGNGLAGLYVQDQQVMHITRSLAGAMFRSVAGPSESQCQAFVRQQRHAQAQELCGQIQARMGQGGTGGVEDLHHKLVDLGFDRVSWALRAQHAAQEQDVIGELDARRTLAGLLEGSDARSAGSLERFAELLVLTWRLQEAIAVFERMRAGGAETPISEWLSQGAELMAGSQWVVQAEGSIETLVEAADVMERPFRGRWLWEASDALVFPQSGLTAQALADKYEQVRGEKGLDDLPHARASRFWWIEREGIHERDIVSLQSPQAQAATQYQLGIRLDAQDHQCLLTPCVILDAGTGQEPGDWRRHNRHIRRLCAQLTCADSHGLWPSRIQKTVKLAMRRLRTSSLWPWRR